MQKGSLSFVTDFCHCREGRKHLPLNSKLLVTLQECGKVGSKRILAEPRIIIHMVILLVREITQC
jgi:hypothetical protein